MASHVASARMIASTFPCDKMHVVSLVHEFAPGDRVVVTGHWEFPDGTLGVIVEPPPYLTSLAGPGEWSGHQRKHAARKGTIVSYFVRFDTATDDGSGDGPYGGGEIEADALRPVLG